MIVRLDMLRLEHSVQEAPVATVCVMNSIGKRSSKFMARIDTGADITCVPEKCATEILLPCFKKVNMHLSDGRRALERTRRAWIEVWSDEQRFCLVLPEQGVLLWGEEFGLLGMDVLKSLHIEGSQGQWQLSFPQERENERDNCSS